MKNEKEVSGLNIGSDKDINSTGIGDLTFVRGIIQMTPKIKLQLTTMKFQFIAMKPGLQRNTEN